MMQASDLLKRVFAGLRAAKLPFVVLRNYKLLPDEWENDIDILVGSADLESVHAIVLETIQAATRTNTIHVMCRINFRATRYTCADRELHIDLYSAMSKGWATYADTAAILDARRHAHALFDVPTEPHELLLIAAKELFAYGEIRARYHRHFAGHDPELAHSAAVSVFGRFMTAAGLTLVAAAMVNPTVKGRPALKMCTLVRPEQALRWAVMRRNRWTVLPATRGGG